VPDVHRLEFFASRFEPISTRSYFNDLSSIAVSIDCDGRLHHRVRRRIRGASLASRRRAAASKLLQQLSFGGALDAVVAEREQHVFLLWLYDH
jgi:hypothetical protein